MRPLRLVLPVGVLAALALAPSAAAFHNQDLHSPNMTELFRSPRSTFTNSDAAFWRNRAYLGNYGGVRIFDITNPAAPVLLSDFRCNGAPGDVSVWKNLLFRSVDAAQQLPGNDLNRACEGTNLRGTATGFEGIQILDVSNAAAPRLIKAVPTDCGSHTHTTFPDLANNRLIIYVSSFPASQLGATAYGTQCSRTSPGHDKISVIVVPLDARQNAAVTAMPRMNLRGDFLGLAGFKGCHDISVLLPLRVAAGACLTEGQMWDISDPVSPQVRDRLFNRAIDTCSQRPLAPGQILCLWRSAGFTWDGKYAIFGDEAGGGDAPECEATDPTTKGAFWLHAVANPVNPISHFKIPRPQALNCTAHMGNVVPVNGRYVWVSAWYEGGTSVADWSNVAAPREIAFYDAQGANTANDANPRANTWSSQWYNDFIHVNDIFRGYEVFRLEEPWRTSAFDLHHFNPQTQENLVQCTVTVRSSKRLRARRSTTLTANVRVRSTPPLSPRGPSLAPTSPSAAPASASRRRRTCRESRVFAASRRREREGCG